jgi:Asp-tRNA(Asn)/Glu-tRNA(Gln) amidotransferase C subunit
MAYLPPSGRPPIPIDELRDLARTVGLTIPEEDLAPLSTALRDQLASIERLDALDLDGVAPALRFDPRWHES